MSRLNWPATGEELKEAGYKSTDRGTCRSCGAAIIWTETPAGKKMPMERVQVGPARFQAHFVSCPNATKHRRRQS